MLVNISLLIIGESLSQIGDQSLRVVTSFVTRCSCDFEGKGRERMSWVFGAEISTLARTKCLELGLVDFSTFLTIKINLKDNLKSVA